jgi:predicted nucleic acid-binding protein
MIVYLDTSSLIKLYVDEDGTPQIRRLVEAAEVVATSVVAYPEARSALARLRREGCLTETEHNTARNELDRDWQLFLALDVSELVWRGAGDLAERRALRGFDSLHLASYLSLAAERSSAQVEFSSFDEKLNRAARAERRRR